MLEQMSQELCQVIEQISERQELLATLQKDAPEKFHEQMFQEIKDLEEQIFQEELGLLEKKRGLERFKKERVRAKVVEGERKACGERCSYQYGKWMQESGQEG